MEKRDKKDRQMFSSCDPKIVNPKQRVLYWNKDFKTCNLRISWPLALGNWLWRWQFFDFFILFDKSKEVSRAAIYLYALQSQKAISGRVSRPASFVLVWLLSGLVQMCENCDKLPSSAATGQAWAGDASVVAKYPAVNHRLTNQSPFVKPDRHWPRWVQLTFECQTCRFCLKYIKMITFFEAFAMKYAIVLGRDVVGLFEWGVITNSGWISGIIPLKSDLPLMCDSHKLTIERYSKLLLDSTLTVLVTATSSLRQTDRK